MSQLGSTLKTAPILSTEKKWYLFRQIIVTVTGGLQFYDESKQEFLSLLSILIHFIRYALFPGITLTCALIIDNKTLAWVIAGVSSAIISSIFQIYSRLQKVEKASQKTFDWETQSQSNFFLVKKKQISEILYCVVGLGVVSSLFTEVIWVKKSDYVFIIPMLCSFYSLVNESPQEHSMVVAENSNLGFYSSQFMRVPYMILLLALRLIINETIHDTQSRDSIESLILGLVKILPLFWGLGLLPNILILALWGLERINIVVMGMSLSASDFRTVLGTIVNGGFILIIKSLVDNMGLEFKYAIIILAIAAGILSENIFFSLSLANSKFSLQSVLNLKNTQGALSILAVILLNSGAQITAGLIDIQIEGTLGLLISILSIAIIMIIQAGQKRMFLKNIFQSLNKQVKNANLIQWLRLLVQTVIEVLFILMAKNKISSLKKDQFAVYFTIYRQFRMVSWNLQETGLMMLESLTISHFYFNDKQDQGDAGYFFLTMGPFLCVVNYFVPNLFNRVSIWFYSLVKMYSDQKQRINNLCCFSIFTLTLYLPINIFSVFYSSFIDCPMIPLLGVPLYHPGFPRSKRFWHVTNNAIKSSGESLLYQQFTESFSEQFENLAQQFACQFQPGQMYLIRIQKYLAIVQILEAGRNYLIFQVRGLESQQMTSCHNTEATRVDDLVTKYFGGPNDQKGSFCCFTEVFGSIRPFKELSVMGYEENKMKFIGFMEDEDFGQGFCDIYRQMLVYYADKLLSGQHFRILEFVSNRCDEVYDADKTEQYFPTAWAEFIQVKKEKAAISSGQVIVNINKEGGLPDYKFELDEYSKENLMKEEKQREADKKKVDESGKSERDQKMSRVEAIEFYNQPSIQQRGQAGGSGSGSGSGTGGGSGSQNDSFDNSVNLHNLSYRTNLLCQKDEQVGKKKDESITSKQKYENSDFDDFMNELSSTSDFQFQNQESKPSQNFQLPKLSQHSNHKKGSKQKLNLNEDPHENSVNQKENLIRRNFLEKDPLVISHHHLNHAIQLPALDLNKQQEQKYENSNGDDNNIDITDNLEFTTYKSPQNKEEDQNFKSTSNNILNSTPLNIVPSKNDSNNKPELSPGQFKVTENRKGGNQIMRDNAVNILKSNNLQPIQMSALMKSTVNDPKKSQEYTALNQNTTDNLLDLLEDLENELGTNSDNKARPGNPREFDLVREDSKDRKGTKDSELSQEILSEGKNRSAAYYSLFQEIVLFLYVLTMNDSQFNRFRVDQEAMAKVFTDYSFLQGHRIFANSDSFLVFYKIATLSMRMAIKIAIETFTIQGGFQTFKNQDLKEAIEENQKNCYIGVGSDQGWQDACEQNQRCLWSLKYFTSEGVLGGFISYFKEIQCSIFELNSDLVTQIWANLQWELLYATNDDDERYSIQTHKQFLRNIIIESANQPLGYSPFYSGSLIINN